MAFEVTGKLEVIFDTQQISDRFKKREFVLMIQDGMYHEYIKMQLLQDKCDLLNGYTKGDEIKVSFNLKGKPYQKGSETLYFTNLDAWRVERLSASTPASSSSAQSQDASPTDDITGITFSEAPDDELPF